MAEGTKPTVAIAWVHSDDGPKQNFFDSLWAMRDWDSAHDNVIKRKLEMRAATLGLVDARNRVAAQILDPESGCDWLLWIDTDMGFEPDALDRLLAVADPVKRPVVGGLCFVQRQYAHDGMNGFWTRPTPTLWDWQENSEGGSGFLYVPIYPVNAVMRVAATGSAFILIHRSVFERIAEHEVERDGEAVKLGPVWYNQTPAPDGQLLGEDMSFCVRCALVDVPVYVHTGVRTSHYKAQWLQEVDHWRRYEAPPATERTAVIVPVLRRPQNAAPFMASLRASTGLATVYAIADQDDPETVEAWRAAGAEVIVDNVVTFAKKCNLGYRKTSEPWLFIVGDDVKFHPGWLDHAQHVADVFKEAQVVGTNDFGNQAVMRGEHATHMLIRRSYVDEVGASWDGPGVVCHEGYRHWFVDNELVAAASLRRVFQPALGSVVEHLHPLWGKGEDDEVYNLGRIAAVQDEALWQERLAAHVPVAVES